MILVNGRFLTQETTGVQRFARQICIAMLETGQQLHFLVPDENLDTSGLESQKFTVVGNRKGHLWEQIDLPLHMAKIPDQTLLSLCSTAPMLLKNQISTHHDITYVRHRESFSWKFRLLYRLLVPIFLRRSKAIITVSEFSKREISSFYKIALEKVTVVPNAVDSRFLAKPSDDEDPYFLAVASPNLHKNFDRLVGAHGQYRASGGTTRLVIAGSQPKHFTQGATQGNHVEYLGRVSDADLVTLYAKARAFLFPSLYEGFGIPPLEAQAVGTPVAAASVAAMPEVLQDSVAWFNPYSEAEMTATMARLDGDPELRDDIRSRGLANVARFSWIKSAGLVVDLLNRT